MPSSAPTLPKFGILPPSSEIPNSRGLTDHNKVNEFDHRPNKFQFNQYPDKTQFQQPNKSQFDQRPDKPHFDQRPDLFQSSQHCSKSQFDQRPNKSPFDQRPHKNQFDQRPDKPQFDQIVHKSQLLSHPLATSLLEHFRSCLSSMKKPLSTASDMMVYWRLAGHNQQSLHRLLEERKPSSAKAMRLCLLGVLHLVPAGNVPMSVVVSDLLDMTIEFFLPMFVHVDGLGGEGVVEVTRDLGGDLEERIASLKPLQVFIVNDIKTLQTMYGCTDNYIIKVSKDIQTLLAKVGVDLFNLKKDFRINGEEYVSDKLRELLKNWESDIPKGMDISAIINLSTNFLLQQNR